MHGHPYVQGGSVQACIGSGYPQGQRIYKCVYGYMESIGSGIGSVYL